MFLLGLSAAALHGAAHQQPMVFQVVTNKPTREMHAGKVSIQFLMSRKVGQMPVIKKQTETGTMRVATPETTAFDLVRYQTRAGHFSNVATVLSELIDCVNVKALVGITHLVKISDVQRLGYLLDMVSGESEFAAPLAEWLGSRRPRAIPLYPGKQADVKVDNRWHILPNVELEVEL